MFQDPQGMPETTDNTEPYIYTYYAFPVHTHLFTERKLLFGTSKSPASPLLCFGTTVKYSKGDLSASTAIS